MANNPRTTLEFQTKYDWVTSQLKPIFGDLKVTTEILDNGRECRIHVFNAQGKRTTLVVEHVPRKTGPAGIEIEDDFLDFQDNPKNRVVFNSWLKEVKAMWRIK